MSEPARVQAPDLFDQRVYFHDVSWEDYERLVEMRGDDPGIRMTYLEGVLEIMTPSRPHERSKKRLARLIEAWSEELAVDLEGVGRWTLRRELEERGLEPDECYFVGADEPEADAPDLAICSPGCCPMTWRTVPTERSCVSSKPSPRRRAGGSPPFQ